MVQGLGFRGLGFRGIGFRMLRCSIFLSLSLSLSLCRAANLAGKRAAITRPIVAGSFC